MKMLKEGSDHFDRVKFLQEAAIMGQFRHHNIVQLYGVITEGESVSLSLCVFTCVCVFMCMRARIHACVYIYTVKCSGYSTCLCLSELLTSMEDYSNYM